MKKNQIAAQGYTLHSICPDRESADKAFAAVKAIGYDAIQISALWHLGVDTLVELCRKHELEVCATHIAFSDIVNDFDKVVADHKALGCKYVGIGSMPAEARESLDACRAFVKQFNEYGLRLKEEGLTLIYHNHHFELADLGGGTLMDVLFEEGDPEAWQFEIDTHWIVRGFNDPVKWIRKVGGRMDCIHFKDLVNLADGPTYAEIGEGTLNWGEIVPACRSIGVKWYIVEQDVCKGSPIDSLKISYDNMVKMI